MTNESQKTDTQANDLVYNALGLKPVHIDKLAELTGLAIPELIVPLFDLEYKGLIKQLPGKYFVKPYTITYRVAGVLYGDGWGTLNMAYPFKPYCGDNLDVIKSTLQNDMDHPGREFGDFSSISGALLDIRKTETRMIDSREFEHIEDDIEFIGDLSDDTKEWLIDYYLSIMGR